jgi:hypothetical protein
MRRLAVTSRLAGCSSAAVCCSPLPLASTTSTMQPVIALHRICLCTLYQCYGSGIRIFSNPNTRSEFFPPRIPDRIKEIKYFNPKKLFLSSRKNDPDCSSRILIFYPSLTPGSQRNRIPDPQHCLLHSASYAYESDLQTNLGEGSSQKIHFTVE